jgi:hypothetical protein
VVDLDVDTSWESGLVDLVKTQDQNIEPLRRPESPLLRLFIEMLGGMYLCSCQSRR